MSASVLSSVSREFDIRQVKNLELIKAVQTQLAYWGYYPDWMIDGIVGERTLEALARFKKDRWLEHPYLIGKTTIEELLKIRSSTKYVMPTMGVGRLTSPFGWRELNGRRKMHNGVDIGASEGTPIYSIAKGKVIQITNLCQVGERLCGGGWGNFIKIEHDNNIQSLYAHLSNTNVNRFDEIKQGQVIGRMGNTGFSFGSHLHFEVYKDGIRIDPLSIMRVV
jgi:murein DD-endopeptidase MepM/ murein hydrolase activator NlpD